MNVGVVEWFVTLLCKITSSISTAIRISVVHFFFSFSFIYFRGLAV